jgi:hypothetical protein
MFSITCFIAVGLVLGLLVPLRGFALLAFRTRGLRRPYFRLQRIGQCLRRDFRLGGAAGWLFPGGANISRVAAPVGTDR